MEDIRKFYELLEQKETELRAIKIKEDTSEIVSRKHINNFSEFLSFCVKYDKKANVYAGIHERKTDGTKLEDVKSVRIIPVDIDAIHPSGIAATDEELEEAKEVADEIYNDLTMKFDKPPMMVMTGNGYQLLWKIPKIEVNDENRKNVEAKVKSFINNIIDKYKVDDRANIDQIGDLARVLKVPGTTSVKGSDTEDRPWRKARIAKNPEPEENQSLKDHILLLKTRKKKAKELKEDKNFDSDRFQELLQEDDKLKDLFEGNILDDYISRSEAEYALIHKLLFYEVPKDQIWKIMSKAKLGKWADAHEQYRKHTYEKAKQNIDETISTIKGRSTQKQGNLKKDLILMIKILGKSDGEIHTSELKKKFGDNWMDIVAEQDDEYLYYDEDSKSIFLTGRGFKKYREIEKGVREIPEDIKVKTEELLRSPDLLKTIKGVLDQFIVGEDRNKLFVYLVALSSKTNDPLSILLTGDSSSGKSYIVKNVLKLFRPRRDYYTINRGTGSALDRVGDQMDMDNKIIYIQELRKTSEFVEQLKLGLSEGQLGLFTVKKNKQGNFEVEMIETTLNISLITTNLSLNVPQDMLNRTFISSCDLSNEQTERIMNYQAERMLTDEKPSRMEVENLEVIQAIPQLLESKDISILYSHELKKSLEFEQVRARRDFERIGRLIKACAFLHQKQRPEIEIDGKEKIVATLDDFRIVKWVLEHSLVENLLNLSPAHMNFYNLIKDLDNPIEVENLVERTQYVAGTVRKYMDELENAGLVLKTKDGRKNVYKLLPRRQYKAWKSRNPVLEESFSKEDLLETLKKISKNNRIQDKDYYEKLYNRIISKGVTGILFAEEQSNDSTESGGVE